MNMIQKCGAHHGCQSLMKPLHMQLCVRNREGELSSGALAQYQAAPPAITSLLLRPPTTQGQQTMGFASSIHS